MCSDAGEQAARALTAEMTITEFSSGLNGLQTKTHKEKQMPR
jgi:hypothetical protein